MTDRPCPCGRPGCDDPTPMCVLCPTLGRGRPNHTDQSPTCPACAQKLAAIPDNIATTYTFLGWALLLPESGRTGDGRSTSPDPALPFPIDAHDLLAPGTAVRHPDNLRSAVHEQIGHLPVAVTLQSWVRDWADQRSLGEHPDTTVRAMCVWLTERTPWAAAHHPAVDEYATEMLSLRGALNAIVGRDQPDERPKPLPGVPCVRCRRITLVRRPDSSVECTWEDCRRVYSEAEWNTASKAAAQAARRGQITREDINA